MEISKQQLEEFKMAYQDDLGVVLDDATAKKYASEIISFCEVLCNGEIRKQYEN